MAQRLVGSTLCGPLPFGDFETLIEPLRPDKVIARMIPVAAELLLLRREPVLSVVCATALPRFSGVVTLPVTKHRASYATAPLRKVPRNVLCSIVDKETLMKQ